MRETQTIDIARPVDEVFRFLIEPQNRLKYDTDLIAIHHSPAGPLRLGSQIVETRQFLGREGRSVTEVSELEPNRAIGYRSPKGDAVDAHGVYKFASIPDGTQLSLEFTLSPRGVVRLAMPLITRRLKRDIAVGLRNIKAIVESEHGLPVQTPDLHALLAHDDR